MKHNCTQSGKFRRLVRSLRPVVGEANAVVSVETIATGILERIWHLTIVSAPQGDLGKIDDETIAEAVGWNLEAELLIKTLVDIGWLDRCSVHRLVVHDWAEHCPGFIRGNLARHQKDFVSSNSKPNLTKPNLTPKQAANSKVLEHATKQAAKQKGDFESFWEIVHRKEAKGKAELAFVKARKKVSTAKGNSIDEAGLWLIERMAIFAKSAQAKDSVKGTLHPATWLNQARYDDDAAIWNGNNTSATKVPFLPPRRKKVSS